MRARNVAVYSFPVPPPLHPSFHARGPLSSSLALFYLLQQQGSITRIPRNRKVGRTIAFLMCELVAPSAPLPEAKPQLLPTVENLAKGWCWELEPKTEEDGTPEPLRALSRGLSLLPGRSYWEYY